MHLKEYQKKALDFTLARLENSSGAGLWLDMGLGKTAVVLHAIQSLREKQRLRALVVAPSRVVDSQVWPNEIKKWGMDLRIVSLDSYSRTKKNAMQKINEEYADIYAISCDSLHWIIKNWIPYDLLIVDESSKFKNWSARRTKLLRVVASRISKRVTLTGTPTPNDLGEVFPQQFILDEGSTLGKTIGEFRKKYMEPCGYEMREWRVRSDQKASLKNLIAPWYIHQDSMVHLDLPQKIENIINVDMPQEAWDMYSQLEDLLFADISAEEQIVAFSSGQRYLLLRQLTGGAMYGGDGEYREIHTAKIDALLDLISDLGGRPLMVAYSFRHEVARLKKRIKGLRTINGDSSASDARKTIADWKQGSIPVLAVQSQSVSHGIDGLQLGGRDLCWFSLTDRPEDRSQLEKRLHRQGVKGSVTTHHIIVDKTVDSLILRRLIRKGMNQSDLLNAIGGQRSERESQ